MPLLECRHVTNERVTQRWEAAGRIPADDPRRLLMSACYCCAGPCLLERVGEIGDGVLCKSCKEGADGDQ